jgi:hypothetical protein
VKDVTLAAYWKLDEAEGIIAYDRDITGSCG